MPSESKAVQRLRAARAEQRMVRRLYEQAVGTPAEQGVAARLRAATLRVTRYEQLVRMFERPTNQPQAG